MRDYVRGLLGPVGRKNSWQLAEFAGHPTPDGLQHLFAKSRWEADGIRDDLQGYVADHLGTDDGILIVDDIGFVKKGPTSAGVQRQYSGTAGRTENCQIGVFAAYATTRGHALVDRELYLPKSWTDDPERCRTARIPDNRPFATKNELARTMVLRAQAGPLPVAWVAADAAYDRTPASDASWKTPASPTSWPCPSPSRCTAPASNTSLAKLPPRRGSGSPAATAPKDRDSTTGLPPVCRRSGSSTVTSPPGNVGCLPAAASPSPTSSPTSSHPHPWTPPSPISFRLPVPLEDREVLPAGEERMRPGPVRSPPLRRPAPLGGHRTVGRYRGGRRPSSRCSTAAPRDSRSVSWPLPGRGGRRSRRDALCGDRSLVRPAAPGAQLPRTITAMPPTGRSLRYWAIWKGAKASLPTSSVTTSSSSMSRCSIGLSVSVWVSSFCP